jgi:PAS domain S-box-containing protein
MEEGLQSGTRKWEGKKMSTSSLQTWICRNIVENSGDAIMFADREGIIRLWNRGAEHMFGYSPVEALGQSLDLIIPENLRDRHWDGYYRVMESGESRYSTEMLSAPALRKDGTRISTEFSMVMVKGEDGTVLGVAAVIRDVSARWKREKELKERVRLLEGQQAG